MFVILFIGYVNTPLVSLAALRALVITCPLSRGEAFKSPLERGK